VFRVVVDLVVDLGELVNQEVVVVAVVVLEEVVVVVGVVEVR